MVARLLLGQDQWGTMCFRTTKPGYDAFNLYPATSPGAFTFASDWDRVEEILVAGQAYVRQITTGGALNYIPYPDQGYIPHFNLYMNESGNSKELAFVNFGGDDASFASQFVGLILTPGQLRASFNTSYTSSTLDPNTDYLYDFVIWKLRAA